jgi:hypothetical protein
MLYQICTHDNRDIWIDVSQVEAIGEARSGSDIPQGNVILYMRSGQKHTDTIRSLEDWAELLDPQTRQG